MQDIIKELTGYLYTIETFDKDSAQDGQVLHAYLIDLTNKLARANYIMADYKRLMRKEKATNYLKLAASSQAQEKYYAPSLAKDFIDAQSSDLGFVFDLAERTSRTILHTMDGLRTIISSLKSERSFAQFQQ